MSVDLLSPAAYPALDLLLLAQVAIIAL